MAMLGGSKTYTLAAIGVGFVGALFAIVGGGGLLSLLGGLAAGLGAVLGVLFWRYGYIMVPLITSRAKIIMMSDLGYEIPPTQDVIVKSVGGVYYASAFLGMKIFESATEKTAEENLVYSQFFERAISNIKYVTKITYLLYVEDVTEKRKSIETKRAEAQLKLARERDKAQPDVLKMDKLEREVQKEDNELARLVKGVKPMGVIAYAQTTAVGVSKDAAMSIARNQAKEIRTSLENALNVEVTQLSGDEMLKCFEWEKFFPTTVQELEESVV
ncbi:Uncharacterised protein [Candidatus Bilamarchaeum dharawalense]|uniref:SPFH domain / Band 7 family protein n=1 Tax=Candidatus Bilamarchaeum dharawalense TaxID=2885759 RepID=A0A5E4LRK0_9ARCH|nr:Uncharacterised protein [Candidatus Bilamarchaeum dharawalense]